MAKKGYASYEEALAAAERHNAIARQSRLPLPQYEVYHYQDPVTGERKWFLRQKRA